VCTTSREENDVLTDASRPLYEVKANLFKGLAHPARIRVLELLSGAEEVSVSELLAETGLEASNLSQHLGVLRRFLLVTGERRGSLVYYRLAHREVAELLTVARALLGAVLQNSRDRLAVAEELPTLADRAR
jgi:ArsR family transcriptional regulator